ncbi:MAG: transposase, partial [Thermoplasmata archaeon]
MKCPQYNYAEDRDFIAALNPRMQDIRDSPERVGGLEGRTPDDGPMNANPYGIILLEKQRLGLR